jgi:hypothetical protein
MASAFVEVDPIRQESLIQFPKGNGQNSAGPRGSVMFFSLE